MNLIPTDIFFLFSTTATKNSALRVSPNLKGQRRLTGGEIMSVDAKRVQAAFLTAVEIADAGQRAAYLDQECSADPDLRQRVDALLQAHEAPASILARPVATPIDVEPKPAGRTAQMDAAEPSMGNPPKESDTLEAESNVDDGPSPLEILQPSSKPGSLGRLSHYEVLEVLGQGGFGTVVRAYDEKLQRMIAIKIMSPRLAATSPARKRFMREARSSAAIRHENVVDIHAIEEQPIPFLVMEYVAGETLQERLDRVGPLETLEVLRIGVQIARGLAAAHAMGKIHRDIKPANIMLENGVDRVKITDFGLARAADDASLTQSGLIAGTPMYMAPEQAQGVALDHRADLFSFGSVLYVMCSGRPPFRASTTLAVLKRVADDTPRPIREIIPEVPEWLCDIITKLHAKNANERFQTAKEVADVLSKYLTELQMHGKVTQDKETGRQGDKEITVPGKSERDTAALTSCLEPPRRRGRGLAVAAAMLLCLVGGIAFTEATGVTKLRSTVIRILTPDGTLIVEVDDPGVKVTVEGDGGLVITGAGLEEIRLRHGSYKVHANRDGKPVMLDRELVSIAKGGREVVKVKLEPTPTLVVAKTEKGAFVLLAAAKERKFDTLAEAVAGASEGDTVEIRGNGPFITQPISINNRALTIRAGAGFWPVIKADPDEQGKILLESNSRLVLEGLDLQWVEAKPFDPSQPGPRNCRLVETSAHLHAVNCRFLMNRRKGPHNMQCIGIWDSSLCQLRNCQLLVGGSGTLYTPFMFRGIPNSTVMVDNCLMVGNGMQPALRACAKINWSNPLPTRCDGIVPFAMKVRWANV